MPTKAVTDQNFEIEVLKSEKTNCGGFLGGMVQPV